MEILAKYPIVIPDLLLRPSDWNSGVGWKNIFMGSRDLFACDEMLPHKNLYKQLVFSTSSQ